jgi:flagellin
MAQTINTNISSLIAQRNLSSSQGQLTTSISRLSSGLRINSAKDDAAGLAIANRMDTQARGMNVAIRNSMDGISLAQTAEGGLGKISDMLQRMRELAVQSVNATNTTNDRTSLNNEFIQMTAEITRTLTATKFNGLAIIGTDANTQTFQVGANAGDVLAVTTNNMSSNTAVSAAIATTSEITSVPAATTAISAIDSALDAINTERSTYGAMQNRFEAIIANLQVAAENQTAARSRIVDADFAAETAALTRTQILQQAGTAMLAQANQIPQQVLQLLKG